MSGCEYRGGSNTAGELDASGFKERDEGHEP